MLKNVMIKKVLKSTVSPILSVINNVVPKKDEYVLLYSPNHGIEHNLRPFRDFLLENKQLTSRYRIVCSVSDRSFFESDGFEYITQIKGMLFFFRAKHVFYTTGQIPVKPSKNQIVIHIDHGTTAIKTGNLLTNIHNGNDFFFTYYCAPSPEYVDVVKAEFNCGNENVIINSEPVTDIFFQPTESYELGNYKKIGLWAPTFRQSDYLGYDDSTEEALLPTLEREDYDELNMLLKEYNVKLIVKLHDMQDLSKYDNMIFSNLEIYSGVDFQKKGFNLYRLLKQTDFLLADYSSVFMQYLLLDRPIGFVIPDIEEYKEKRGFVFQNVLDYMPGQHITTKDGLFDFIRQVSSDIDAFGPDRKRVNNKVNYYQDGKSCERLVAFSKMN